MTRSRKMRLTSKISDDKFIGIGSALAGLVITGAIVIMNETLTK